MKSEELEVKLTALAKKVENIGSQNHDSEDIEAIKKITQGLWILS